MISVLAGGLGDLIFLPAMLKLMPWMLPRKSHTKNNAKVLSLLLVGALFTALPKTAQAADSEAVQILKKVQQQIQSKDEEALVKLKIIESNGEEKVRELKLKTLKNSKFFAIARIQSPKDLKGTAVLAVVDAESENQWLYLPSSKQVRRVVSGKKSGGLLGSELSLEDLDSTAIKNAKVNLLSKTDKAAVIEIVPQKGTSAYDKVQTSIDMKEFVPLKTLYFQDKKVKKTVEFLNYKKFGKVWRAQSIRIRNNFNKRGTDLEISKVQIDKNLSEDSFSPNSLKNDE